MLLKRNNRSSTIDRKANDKKKLLILCAPEDPIPSIDREERAIALNPAHYILRDR